MINGNPNISLGFDDCSLYTRHIALKDDYNERRKDILAFILVKFNYSDTIEKTFTFPARQNQLIQKNIFNNAPFRRSGIAKKTKSAFNGSSVENPSWYQQFNFLQIRMLRVDQLIVEFDAFDKFCLCVTAMKAMNFQDDIPSFLIDNFKDYYVLVFDLTSMQDAAEDCHYPEVVQKLLRLELNFTFPLEHVTELILLGEQMSAVAIYKFGIDTMVVFSLRLFQLLTMTPLPL